MALTAAPQVLLALNPMYGINYLMNNGLAGFLILSSVILCATVKPCMQTWDISGGNRLFGLVSRFRRTFDKLSRPGSIPDDASGCKKCPV